MTQSVIIGPWRRTPTPAEARLARTFILMWRDKVSTSMTEHEVIARLPNVSPTVICTVWPIIQWARWDAQRQNELQRKEA